ncbi:MAG: RNA 2',3'-cyclic phosphodiesterase [Phycisphaerales bacterium]|nr:MAG: RNA 2',3'-cyclic phosphodiesterase [Phycisphaerales bacterium]
MQRVMPGDQPRLRLFVAVYPPGDRVTMWCRTLAALSVPDYRLVPAEQVHLTLQFIGPTPVKELERVRESVARAAKGLSAFRLTPEAMIRLPERGRARLLAVRTDAPATLLELQRRLAQRLARSPRKDPGDRFLPHLTLCRFRPPTSLPDGTVPELVENESFEVDTIHLMKSTLHPDGAKHEVVDTVTLGT